MRAWFYSIIIIYRGRRYIIKATKDDIRELPALPEYHTIYDMLDFKRGVMVQTLAPKGRLKRDKNQPLEKKGLKVK